MDVTQYGIDAQRGFLPRPDPLARLDERFAPWEDAAAALPKLLAAGRARGALAALTAIDAFALRDERARRRAMLLLSYFGHAYVWGEPEPMHALPATIAAPWAAMARTLGRPPVLSYASYALDNWRRLDPDSPIALGNIVLLQNFLGGVDEEWFILVHVAIEAQAAPALVGAAAAHDAAAARESGALARALEAVATALERMLATLERMPERCDPYIYFHRVRPYIHGWKDHPALPNGLLYEGVPEFGGRPQRFRGETGAQSAIVPTLDAALGITHADDPLAAYLREMRDYMPPQHRALIAALERSSDVREAARASAGDAARRAYNECVRLLGRFRSLHLSFADRYIARQSADDAANPSHVGTAGTPFMAYLRKHRDETEEQLL